jgi:hypothetical protein
VNREQDRQLFVDVYEQGSVYACLVVDSKNYSLLGVLYDWLVEQMGGMLADDAVDFQFCLSDLSAL